MPAGRVAGSYLLSLLLLAGVAAGCAVLTTSQVQEVERFAKATDEYGALPDAAMDAHRDVRLRRQLFFASTLPEGSEILRAIDSALRQSSELRAEATRARDALRVLDLYADQLTLLSSDEFTTDLEEASRRLGRSLDQAIAEYNRAHGASLGLIGGTVAAAVRAGGGLYIRYRQATLLREYVTGADGIVAALTRDVQALMGLYLGEGQTPGLIDAEVAEFRQTVAAAIREPAPLDTVRGVAETLRRAERAKALAAAVRRSAEEYRKAHARLATVVQRRTTLRGFLEETQALAAEIRAAQKLRRELSN
jgi:hypothetical protein